MENKYKCICGKTFDSIFALSGHKSHCKEYQLTTHGNLDKLNSFSIKESCPYCGRKISRSNITKHIKSHENGNYDKKLKQYNNSYHLDHEDLVCKFCGKKCKNKNSLAQHEIRCNNNPNKINTYTAKGINNPLYGKPSWNKGLTKDTDERVKNLSRSLLDFYENNEAPLKGKKLSDEHILKMKNNPKCGGLRHGAGKGKKGWYKGIYCDSTYELVYVIYNIDHNISFKRCKRVYEYEYNGEIHKYHPDFELEDGTLIEIKGYINDIVYIKLNAVTDRKIIMLTKEDLEYAFNYVKTSYEYTTLEDLYTHS